MTDYSNASLYMILRKNHPLDKDCYIGSTADFKMRVKSHRSNCYNPNCKDYTMKVYDYIRSNGGWDEFEMVELYKFPCDSKTELKNEERKLIKQYNSTLNTYIPNRTPKEYYHDNVARISARNKKRYSANPQLYIEKNTMYYRKNKERFTTKHICPCCGKLIRNDYMRKHMKTSKCLKNSKN